jgi:two-component system chemotaxis response regulator CheY
MIVEDDLSLQRLYEMMLKAFRFEVISIASNGKEAIEIYKSLPNKPDVILMDHRMPVKNGIDATLEILKIQSNSKVIFTSADNSIKKKALEIGATSFIAKPFNVHEIHDEIKRVSSMEKASL